MYEREGGAEQGQSDLYSLFCLPLCFVRVASTAAAPGGLTLAYLACVVWSEVKLYHL